MKDSKDSTQSTESAEMTKYGITRKKVDYYHVGEFRYTSLQEAIMQAKRTMNTAQL